MQLIPLRWLVNRRVIQLLMTNIYFDNIAVILISQFSSFYDHWTFLGKSTNLPESLEDKSDIHVPDL